MGLTSHELHGRSFVQLLPQRPGEANCIYFLRNGRCKYGATCKYHHPTNSFNLEGNRLQQTHYSQDRMNSGEGVSRASSGLLLNHHNHHSQRSNSSMQEGPIATHVLYRSEGSTVVVPVNQGSAFQQQHLRNTSNNNNNNGYDHSTMHHHRKMGGKYQRKNDHPSRNSSPLSYDKVSSSIEFIPASFSHPTQVHRDLSPPQGPRSHSSTNEYDPDSDNDQSHMDRTHSMSSFTPHSVSNRNKLHTR